MFGDAFPFPLQTYRSDGAEKLGQPVFYKPTAPMAWKKEYTKSIFLAIRFASGYNGTCQRRYGLNKFNNWLKKLAPAADRMLLNIWFISGVWVILLPFALLVYFYVTEWQATDPALPWIERFNLMIRGILWESLLVLALLIALKQALISFEEWLEDKASEE